MKKRETKKTVLWAATDMALSVAAMAAAFFIRFVLFRGENPVGGFGYHMLWAGLFSPVYTVLFGLLGVYEPQPQRGFIHEFGNIVLGCTFGVMLAGKKHTRVVNTVHGYLLTAIPARCGARCCSRRKS